MTDDRLLADWLDRLRLTAQTDLAPFQTRDRFGELAGRASGFALYILDSLERLQAEPRLVHFGLAVEARVQVLDSPLASTVVVVHEVSVLEAGHTTQPVDANAFYTACFPFNAVLAGCYTLSRSDLRTRRYFSATERKDFNERRAIVTDFAAEAAEAFSIAELQIVPPPAHADLPFITEPR